MKVLILCCDYPPLNSAGAQRPASWRRYLPEFGVDVHVIASARGGDAPPEDHVERVELPLVLPERILSRHGMHRFVVPRKALSLLYRMGSFVWSRLDKHNGLFEAAARWLEGNRADVILATAEPFILFCHASRLTKRFGIPWIADYRDGWYHNYTMSRDPRRMARLARRHELRFERRAMQNCSLITTVDIHLAGMLADLHTKPTAVVQNGFDEPYEGPADRAGAGDRTLLVSHVGTVTPGQRIEFTLDAVRQLAETRGVTPEDLRVRFVGLRSNEIRWHHVQEAAAGLESYVEYTDHLPRAQALAGCAGSDFLLAPTDAGYSAAYTKIFDYLAARRPILVVPGDGGLLDELVEKCGAGRPFETTGELADFLYAAIEERRNGRAPESGHVPEEVAKHSRARQARVMAEAIRGVVRGG